MTRIDIDAALAAANPLTDRAAARLPLGDAETELVQRVVSIPVDRARRASRSVRPARRRRLAVLLAATAAVAAALMVLPSSDRSGGPAPAFAAPLVRFANASPLVLLQLPGWHVVYADEQELDGYGEMHFVRGPADAQGRPVGALFPTEAALAGRAASLTWMSARTPGGKAMLGGHHNAPTGLGVSAHRFIFEGGSSKAFDISALFLDHGRILTFRATVTSMAMFRAELRALTPVDTTTWLRAMPPSVVEAADSGEVIRSMLKGIPLPPGFDAARIRGARLLHDRYQLGAAVTGTIACMWINDWNRARMAGDSAMVHRAVAAMATAPRWPILREMAPEGGWAQSLLGYAKALRTGWIQLDRRVPVMASGVDSGLGCSTEWGVSLR